MQYETSTTTTETVQTISDCFQEGVFTNAEIQGLLENLDAEHTVVFKALAAISATTNEINSTAIENYRMLRCGRNLMFFTTALLVVIAASLIY
jgi:hypothetical protein